MGTYVHRARNSYHDPQCQSCFLRFTKETPDYGCKGLSDVPEKKCSFHKTPAEQEASLMAAAKRNAEMGALQKRMEDLNVRVF